MLSYVKTESHREAAGGKQFPFRWMLNGFNAFLMLTIIILIIDAIYGMLTQ
jgi:hypothetical protein